MVGSGLGFFARLSLEVVRRFVLRTFFCAARLISRAILLFAASWLMLIGLVPASPGVAQADLIAQIDRPERNEALQGSIQITGTASAPGFASADMSFGYLGDETNTWFLIEEIAQPVTDDTLATWDTTMISDGDYVLRLRVNALDGTYRDATVDIQVRNYTAAEVLASTPTPTAASLRQVPTAAVLPPTKTATPRPPATPTSLPQNPVAATERGIFGSFLQGALVVAGVLVILGVILLRRQS